MMLRALSPGFAPLFDLENAFDKAELQSARNVLRGQSTLRKNIWTTLKI